MDQHNDPALGEVPLAKIDPIGALALGSGVVLMLAAAVLLWSGIPTVQALEGWFLGIHVTPLEALEPVLLILAFAAWAVWATCIASRVSAIHEIFWPRASSW